MKVNYFNTSKHFILSYCRIKLSMHRRRERCYKVYTKLLNIPKLVYSFMAISGQARPENSDKGKAIRLRGGKSPLFEGWLLF